MTSKGIPVQDREWLVEIRVKDWVYIPEGQSRTVTYEEVVGYADEYSARHAGIDQFLLRCKHEPILRRKIEQSLLRPSDFCAPDAVLLNG